MRNLTLFCLCLVAWTGSCLAAHADSNVEIENLKQRIRALERDMGAGTAEDQAFTLESLAGHLEFSGLLELEASYSRVEGDGESSDLVLATAELSTEVEITENIGGHVTLLYEDDSDSDAVNVDEAVISLQCPLHLLGQTPNFDGGKLYVPFGQFNSFMVSDPLTLSLAETRATAIVVGLESDLWTLKFGMFNGDVDTGGEGDNVDGLVVSLSLVPMDGFAFGASYLSDLAESGADLVGNPLLYSKDVAAWSGFLSLQYGHFDIEAELVYALDRFDDALVGGSDLTGPRPRAWNLEAAWLPEEDLQLVVRYESATDYQDDVNRFGGTVSYSLFEHTVVALEYLNADPDAGSKAHQLTGQLAFDF